MDDKKQEFMEAWAKLGDTERVAIAGSIQALATARLEPGSSQWLRDKLSWLGYYPTERGCEVAEAEYDDILAETQDRLLLLTPADLFGVYIIVGNLSEWTEGGQG